MKTLTAPTVLATWNRYLEGVARQLIRNYLFNTYQIDAYWLELEHGIVLKTETKLSAKRLAEMRAMVGGMLEMWRLMA